ncbi:hypothetical protein FACS1894105_14550 [Clostridia bacterium]|nr:hypothetical protein FACS1894105_14550 [Clostridia bacterium]
MTNFEKFKQDLTLEQYINSKFHSRCLNCICNTESCRIDDSVCKNNIIKWGNAEYTEPLKPCPFCGNNDIRINKFAKDYNVMCGNLSCEARTQCYYEQSHAIDAWNRRAT